MAIFNLSLNCQEAVSAPPQHTHTFHFMSTLAESLTSCFSFFIMSVSACAVLSGEPLPSRGKKLSRDQRETRPGVTQTGREWGVGGRGEEGGGWGEERQKRGIETEGKKKDGRAERGGRGGLRMTGGVSHSCPNCVR